MFKDKQHFFEELAKSIQTDIDARAEELRKDSHQKQWVPPKNVINKRLNDKKALQAKIDEHEEKLDQHEEGTPEHTKIKGLLNRMHAELKRMP